MDATVKASSGHTVTQMIHDWRFKKSKTYSSTAEWEQLSSFMNFVSFCLNWVRIELSLSRLAKFDDSSITWMNFVWFSQHFLPSQISCWDYHAESENSAGKPTFEIMQNKRRIAEPDSERSLCWTVISKTRNTKFAFSGSEMASTKSSLLMASPRVVYPDSVWVVLVTTGRYESPSDAPDRVAENNNYWLIHFRPGSE